ncbi:MAG: MFS transporter [Candidatus Eremiobacteraeota bacterium]|nr:MFS transporter [Candidatus Eremiobacteraeota bacterium]
MWRLPKALLPIYGTTLVDTLGYTMMIPLLPGVIREYHASDVMVGALLSVPALCSMVAAPVWGKFSDRLGRKPIIITAQVLTLIGYLAQALSHSLVWIFVARILSGCGGGSLGAVQSYIADVTNEDQRDLGYSLYGAVFGMAFIVGPVSAGFLMKHGLAFPFFVAAGLEVVTIGFAAAFLPGKLKRAQRSTTSIGASLKAANVPGVRQVLIRQFFAIFAIVVFLANFSLYLHHVLHSAVTQVGWLLSVAGGIGGVALIVVVSPLAARIGDRAVAQIGLLLSFAAYGMLGLVTQLPVFFVVLATWAVGSSMVQPTLTALLSLRAKPSERGAIMGVSDSINSLAMILGPAAGSAIVGYNARLLGILPAGAVLAAFAMGRVPRRQGKV